MYKQSMQNPKLEHQVQASTQAQRKESKLSGHMLSIKLIQITSLQVQKNKVEIMFSQNKQLIGSTPEVDFWCVPHHLADHSDYSLDLSVAFIQKVHVC